MNCRHCFHPLEHLFLDLGTPPPSNAYLSKCELDKPELVYPLRVFVCDHCWLVQTEDFSRCEELFTGDYAYFSSISSGWLKHAADYCEKITHQLSLDANSMVVEVASNDGYLLQNFVKAEIPCLGIEPTDSTADAAEKLAIPVVREFFGEALARQLVADGKRADLIVGNNVYAHVPDINDFTLGLKRLLKAEGTVTLEFPHLKNLIEFNQFDTIYHEHYSYLSLHAVMHMFNLAGLQVHDIEELPTHGGSLRIYGSHIGSTHTISAAVETILKQEIAAGMLELSTYQSMQVRVERIMDDLLTFLSEQRERGKSVAAYGAAAKGNTLLNFAAINTGLLAYVCDAAPSKQGKYMPGSHIPILSPDAILERKPDYLLILPWNIKEEIMRQNDFIRGWGGVFMTAVPRLELFE